MYARSTTVRGKPQAMDDGIAYVRDKVMPAIGQMDGCIGLSMLCDREAGRSIVTTSWADAEALHRSADGVMAMRQKAAEIMQGVAEVQEWEIAVVHRRHGIHHGACARVIWAQTDPAAIGQIIDAFRTSILPRLEDLPGFDSCSVLVDRPTGRIATAASYDSRYSMDEGEQVGASLRQEFGSHVGTETLEMAAFDVVLAHLRVPETV